LQAETFLGIGIFLTSVTILKKHMGQFSVFTLVIGLTTCSILGPFLTESGWFRGLFWLVGLSTFLDPSGSGLSCVTVATFYGVVIVFDVLELGSEGGSSLKL
jgi:hypothetical protein